jgi:anti-sigma factor RsiW
MTTYMFLPITEEELHAYVDGELAPERQEAMAAWLAAHPDAAAQVAAWRAQADAIRARYGGVVSEAVPKRLRIEQLLRQNRRPWIAVASAAAIAAFMIGGLTGWMAHGATIEGPKPFDVFTQEALAAYKLYVVEVRHPVEVVGGERAHMTQWLSKRLGYEQHIPDLQALGLKLVGGRLLPGPTGAAAFYMYEGASGERFTIYCGRASAPTTALRYKDQDRVAAFYWVDDKVAYVVSGPGNRDQMEKVTKAIYDQIERRRNASL